MRAFGPAPPRVTSNASRCGGQLVLWDTTLPAFPASGEVAPANWTTGAIVPLPDTLLFKFDSSALSTPANTILQPIVQRARSQHLLVSIIGTASPTAEPAPTTTTCQSAGQTPSATGSSPWACPRTRSP